VRALNPQIAVKIRSAAVHSVLANLSDSAEFIQIDPSTQIQVVETMHDVAGAVKEQRGAFIRDERVLVCWTDDLESIVPLCKEFESKLIKLVWRIRPSSRVPSLKSPFSQPASTAGSTIGLNEKIDEVDEKDIALAEVAKEAPRSQPPPPKKGFFGFFKSKKDDKAPAANDTEKGFEPEARGMRIFAPIYNGLACALSIYYCGNGLNMLITEAMLDHNYVRFALFATAPLLFCVSLFFSLQIVVSIAMVFGPVAQYHENSRYYSAVPPRPNKEVDSKLPHITIEMPVYRESLKETIAPSVHSLKKAMQTYARQGGTSAIFIHDDGLQIISDAERLARTTFYSDHGIGYVARPKHDSAEGGYKRNGRFKKASNMNYGLELSLKLERHLARLEAGEVDATTISGDTFEDKALQMGIEETYEESGRLHRPWAAGARSLRMGEIILIVDSDTIVPEDCFRDAAREMHECPDVAIIQHESSVLQVANHYFENGIAYFTRRVNKSISFACANGEVAAFVGHNAFLRWSALQEVAFVDPVDGVHKIWSDSNVSEDFDMALRLQLKDYIVRWASYSEGAFKEGVSLTPDDELNRWEKYGYGVAELMFNPFVRWFRVGPINKQLRTFLWSNAPVHYKVSMMAYMFSYFGIAAGFMLTVLNYFVLGWTADVDGFYMHSFEIWLACLVVFPGVGSIAFSIMEYRLGQRGFLESVLETVTWIPFFFFFFGGLPIHVSKALLAYMFSYNIQWGATKKEVERSNFFLEVPKILKRFRVALIISFVCIVGIVILSTPLIPIGWRYPIAADWAIVFPFALTCVLHLLYPVVLNPWLMIFSY